MNKEIRQYCDGVSIHEIDEDVERQLLMVGASGGFFKC